MRTKLLLLGAFVYAPLVALLAFVVVDNYRNQRAQLLNQNLQNATLASEVVLLWLNSYQNIVHSLIPLVEQINQRDRIPTSVATEIMTRHPYVRQILLADEEGRIKEAFPLDAASVNGKVSRLMATAANQVEDLVSGLLSPEHLARHSILIAGHFDMGEPTTDGAPQTGAMGLLTNPGELLQLLSQVPLPEGALIVVVDQNSRVVVRTLDPGQWAGREIQSPYLTRALAGEQGTMTAAGVDGISRFQAFSPVSGPAGWAVGVGVPTELVHGPLITHVLLYSLFSIILLLVILAVGSVFYRSIIGRIHLLRLTAQEVGMGRFEMRSHLERNDELGELGWDVDVMASQLQELENLRADFISLIVHDMRTPLSTIRTMIDLILSRRLWESEDKLHKALQSVSRQSLHLQRITDEMLDITRIDSGKLSIESEKLSAQSILKGPLAIIADTAKAGGLELDVNIELDAPLIEGDPTRLKQVFMNLLDNAVKYTPAGKVRVHARSGWDGGGRALLVSISDTGVGLSEEEQRSLFKKFYRPPGPVKRGGVSGTGLGLYMAAKLVELHGGRITVESPGPSQGSKFTVILPAEK